MLDENRVVFLDDTLMEREKDYGYIEMMMTLRFPERNVTFRNLGWSADTPMGTSRAKRVISASISSNAESNDAGNLDRSPRSDPLVVEREPRSGNPTRDARGARLRGGIP